ncbi:unnamed protein product [Coccothraustes coccothraustes]
METRRGARGLSQQGRSSRAPEVLADDGDSMASSIICTHNPGNILSTLTSTDEQHPFELAREATENCGRMWQQFDQIEERTERIRSQYQVIDSLLEEIRSDCANIGKSREMLLQCTGIPEPGAFCLHESNTKQRRETPAQAEKAEQQDMMEVGLERRQIRALQDTVLQMEASQAAQEKQLLKELEESRAAEGSLRDSVHVLEAEVSELRVKLQSSDDKALALAIQCKAVELELRETKAQRDNLRARNLELQKELEENEQEWVLAEARHISRQIALEKEATERQEEAVTLHQEVASLQRKLEDLEKDRKDVLHGCELHQQQMRDPERRNDMHALNIQSQQERKQQRDSERETMPDELKHGAAAFKEGRGNTLNPALSKFKIAKEALQKRLAFLKGKAPMQSGTGIDLQSTPQAVGAQEKQLLRGSRTSLESKQPVPSAEEEKRERPELSTMPRRSGQQVEPERRRTRTFRRVFLPDYFILPVQESAHQIQPTFEIQESSSSSGDW